MELFGQYSALIDCIYRGATDAHAWPGIVQALSLWIGAPKGLMFTPQHLPSAGGFVFPYAMPQSFMESWAARHQPTDLWTQRAFERGLTGEGLIVLDQDLVSQEELTASPWYQNFLRHQDIGRVASGIVFGPLTPNMPITAISFFRSLNAQAYTEEDRARLRLVFPHISRSLGVLLTLRDAEFRVAASISALNRLDAGVLLLNAQGSVAFVNQAGHAMLKERDGLSLLEANPYRGARLSATHDATGQAIERAIRLALAPRLEEAAHFHETIAITRPSGAPPFSLQISPLGQNAGFGLNQDAPSAIAFLVNPQRQCKPDPRQLAALYELTPAEAAVAARLVDGDHMARLAEELGISINTLKTQVKRVYEKMGVDSRAGFVRAVLTHSSSSVH